MVLAGITCIYLCVGAPITGSHVVSSIVDYLYVVGEGIGISITGSKIINDDCICISIDLSRTLLAAL